MARASLARIAAGLTTSFLVYAWTCPAVPARAQSSRTVLVVTWGAEEFPASPIVNAAIQSALMADPHGPIDFFSEFLESDHFPPERASRTLASYIREKYAGRRIDVVIAIADPALRFVLEYRDALFPGAPIVYSGVSLPDISLGADGGFTAVLRGTAFAETLRLALHLHPATQRVFVVAKSRDERVMASAQQELLAFSGVVSLQFVAADTVPRLLDEIRAIPPRSLVLYIWYSQTPPGRVMYEDNDVIRVVAAASPVPVYSTNDDHIGSGVVGGVLRDTRETATRVGAIARSILNGSRAQDIPIENARVAPVFDWRQIQRWGIDPSRLPLGSDVRFRTPTLWESHRQSVAAAVIVVVAQLLLIAGLLMQRVRRRRAEQTIQSREATLRTSYERIRQLTGRLINAQEAARAEIARELHDDVCQELAGVSMAVGSLRRSSGRIDDTDTQKTLASMERSALETLKGVRRLSHDLHPATLRLVGLAAALKTHCREVEERHDVQVSFAAQCDLGNVHPDVALCIFRVAQEALRNGAVHGDARRLDVSVARTDTHLELTVTDDGRGFDLESVRRNGSGLGLVSMEERARLIGGEARIVTQPRRGTAIRVRIPAAAAIAPQTND